MLYNIIESALYQRKFCMTEIPLFGDGPFRNAKHAPAVNCILSLELNDLISLLSTLERLHFLSLNKAFTSSTIITLVHTAWTQHAN